MGARLQRHGARRFAQLRRSLIEAVGAQKGWQQPTDRDQALPNLWREISEHTGAR